MAGTWTLRTVAGSGAPGFADGGAPLFSSPEGVAYDASVGAIFVADTGNFRLRRVTLAGVAATVAGTGVQNTNPLLADGVGTSTAIGVVRGVSASSSGSLDFADATNHKIKFVSGSGIVSSVGANGTAAFCEGVGLWACLNTPLGVARDPNANRFFVDAGNQRVRVFWLGSASPSLAGSGAAGYAEGTGTAASFNGPSKLAWTYSGVLFVCDAGNHVVRTVTIVSTVAGSTALLAGAPGVPGLADGAGTAARFNSPWDIASSGAGLLYVCDAGNNALRSLNPNSGVVTTLVGGGAAGFANGAGLGAGALSAPRGLAISPVTGAIFLADTGNHAVRSLVCAPCAPGYYCASLSNSTLCPAGSACPTGSYAPRNCSAPPGAYCPPGTADPAGQPCPAGTYCPLGNASQPQPCGCAPGAFCAQGVATMVCSPCPAGFFCPGGASDKALCDCFAACGATGLAAPATSFWVASFVAGSAAGVAAFSDGVGSAASLAYPMGVAAANGVAFVCDTNNNRIRAVVAANASVSTWVGSGGTGAANGAGQAATLYIPRGLAADASGAVVIADCNNNLVRFVSASAMVSTLAGSSGGYAEGVGATARFSVPYAVAADGAGSVVVADTGNNRLRWVTYSGVTSFLAGSGAAGCVAGTGSGASFSSINGVAVALDGSRTVFASDGVCHSIFSVSANGAVRTLAGSSGAAGFADGLGALARLSYPSGVAVDGAGAVYFTDQNNFRVRRVAPNGNVTTIAGAGGPGRANGAALGATFNRPWGLAFDANASAAGANASGAWSVLWVADYQNSQLRRLDCVVPPPSPTSTRSPSVSPSATPSNSRTPSITPSFSSSISTTRSAGAPCVNAVSTLAGSGATGFLDGAAAVAQFRYVDSLAVNLSSGMIFGTDLQNNRLRTIDTSGVVGTLAAGFSNPCGIAIQGGRLLVADQGAHRVRAVDAATGALTNFAGSGVAAFYADGVGTGAGIPGPVGALFGPDGTLFVTDASHRLRAISPAGSVTTLAGNGSGAFADGVGTLAAFFSPAHLDVDAARGLLYLADWNNHRVRSYSLGTGAVSTLVGGAAAGGGGVPANAVGTAALLWGPYSVAYEPRSLTLFIGENAGSRIRRLNTVSGLVTVLAGYGGLGFSDGVGTSMGFNQPSGIALDATGSQLYVSDKNNHRIRTALTCNSYTSSPSPTPSPSETGTPSASPSPTGSAASALACSVRTVAGSLAGVNIQGAVQAADGVGGCAALSAPRGLALAPSGAVVAFSDQFNNLIRSLDLRTWAVSTLAGSSALQGSANGPALGGASFFYPTGLAYNASGALFISDFNNHRLRVLAGGVVFTLAGTGATPNAYVNGPAAAATFAKPYGLAVGGDGTLYVADSWNHAVRTVTPLGEVGTLAGQLSSAPPNASSGGYADDLVGTSARFSQPTGVAFHAPSNTIFVADTSNNLIRAVLASSGATSTLAGSPGVSGFADGAGAGARFNRPRAVSLSPGGYLLVADYQSHYVRAVSLAGAVTTLAGNGSAAWADGWGARGSALFQPNAVLGLDAATSLIADTGNNLLRVLTCGAAAWPFRVLLTKFAPPAYAWPQIELAEVGAFTASNGTGANRLAAGGPCASSAIYGGDYPFSGCANAVDGRTNNFFLSDAPAPWVSFSAALAEAIGSVVVWPRSDAVPERISLATVSIISSLNNATLWSAVLGNVSSSAPILLAVPPAAFAPLGAPLTCAPSTSATPSVSASVTGTATASATSSPTPSPTPSSSATASVSLTTSGTASGTQSGSGTPTFSSITTPSRSSTLSGSASATAAASPSASSAAAGSAGASVAGTQTGVATATVIATATGSGVSNAPATATASGAAAASATGTFATTATLGASAANSPSSVNTATALAHAAATATGSPPGSRAPTSSGSSTSSGVASGTASASAATSATGSSTGSGSAAPSDFASATATVSATPCNSGTPSSTATLGSSGTGTPSQSPSGSATPSLSPSPTRTQSGSGIASATSSQTGTLSSSGTPSSSASPTLCATITPSFSGTSSQSPSLGAPPSSTPSPSSSPTVTGSLSGSAAGTASPSATVSASAIGAQAPSVSPTPSATPSGTGSASSVTSTKSPGAVSMGVSASSTARSSGTATATGSGSPTVSLTLAASSNTGSGSLSGTLTSSATPTGTGTSSAPSGSAAPPSPSASPPPLPYGAARAPARGSFLPWAEELDMYFVGGAVAAFAGCGAAVVVRARRRQRRSAAPRGAPRGGARLQRFQENPLNRGAPHSGGRGLRRGEGAGPV
jgi:sugar lactone lactonase YvrE